MVCFGGWRQRQLKLEMEKLVHVPAVGAEVRHIEAESEIVFEISRQSNQTWELTVYGWKWGERAM